MRGAVRAAVRRVEVEVFFELDVFFAAFFGAADLREDVVARAADFVDVVFFDFPAALRETVFFVDAFFPVTDRAADVRATVFFDDFLRAAVLLVDVALFTLGFALDVWGLTLRLLPVVFLLAAALRGPAFFLLAPALLRSLLAAFFAGIRTPAGSEKNAGLYIAYPKLEAQKQGFSGHVTGRRGARETGPESLAEDAPKTPSGAS